LKIHRNGALAFAIYKATIDTGDYSYDIPEKVGSFNCYRSFLASRATFSTHKNQYVILGVTGPNEYRNSNKQ
jgi:maltose phosphorylase